MSTETQPTLEFAPDRSTAGFRLHQFSVLNWGTFHGRVYSFSPDGRTSLLSGGNGAGKSTLADAVLTVLIDSRKRNYNQASAGGGERKQRKERSEKDYILGTYSEDYDQDRGYGRPKQLRKAGESVTVLLAYFYNETFESHVTLAQVLWLTPAGKLDRAYIVAKKKLTIEGDFNDLGSAAEVRHKLKERALDPLDTFTLYSQRFHEALFLATERNPMDIFNQAVCIKDISNLTNFIREFMLDDGGAPQKLEDLRNNFEELRRTYERIEREKKRLDRLNEIARLHNNVQIQEDQIDRWQACLDAAPLFFAETELKLRQEAAEGIDRELLKAQADEITADLEETKQTERVQKLTSAIESSEAGRRLQQIEAELLQLQKQIDERQPRHKRFMKKAETWQSTVLCQSESEFVQLSQNAAKDVLRLGKKSAELGKQLNAQHSASEALTDKQEQISAEVRSLQARESNISDKLVRTRNSIAKALDLSPKQLPFVGELVQVRDSESQWTGAIERLVHSFALSLLVPAHLRKKMDAYVHRTHLKSLVVYHAIDAGQRSTNPQLDDSSVANKLEISKDAGDFKDWLTAELSYRYDHVCCETPDEHFNNAKSAITINGLTRQRGSERRKDDRYDINDRTRDVLGWDNSAKIAALQSQHATLENERNQFLKNSHRLTNEKSHIDTAIKAAESLPDIASQWQELDYFTPVQTQDELKVEEKELRASSNELNSLQEQLTQAKAHKKEANARGKQAAAQSLHHQELKLKNDHEVAQCLALIEDQTRDAEQLSKLREQLPIVRKLLEFPAVTVQALDQARTAIFTDLQEKRRKANSERDRLGDHVKLEMNRFLNEMKVEEPKLHDELYTDGLTVAGYNDQLVEPFENLRARIENEDLPQHQKRFNRLLQTNLIEDVSTFDGLLDQHAQTIKRRIDELNQHLKEVDFDRNKHSYIQLIPERTDDDNQKWFRHHRKYALQDIVNEEDSEAARTERFNRVRSLLNELAADERRTRRVIDVRNWFTFRADEFYREDDRYDQSYSGASGKSGGEKNRLASTILATAIAYQYGISLNNDRQSETFRLVVVDEMFSKTDDEFSTYLLELFKQFNLQLIIVQPLDSKIHLVQKYVERYHIVTRPKQCSEIHNLDVHEYEKLMTNVRDS